MKQIHNITISVFIKEEDNKEQLEQSFLKLIPLDLDKEKLKPTKTEVTGLSENKIKIIELKLIKEKHTKLFLEHLITNLDKESINQLLEQKESRLDNDLCFFLRLDKEALLNDKYQLTDDGNCFHIKILIAAFPKKRDAALETVNSLFKQ
jgi:RNA-binding protein